MIELFSGDNRKSLRKLIDEGVRVHSVVTDPPYGLVSIQKRFGKQNAKAARVDGNDGSFSRLSGGFMGKEWDGTGIERDPEFWKLIYDILLPGGYCFAFSGSRTGHWQACAMEMAGFVMHPMHGWVYGTGFPKAHAADKAIDAKLIHGSARTTDIRQMQMGDDYQPSGRGRVNYDNGGGSKMNGATGTYEPKTPEAEQWQGWAYGTQAQKPALEPIYLAQKPFSEKTGAANLLKHGVGAVNIDGCRVKTTDAEGRYPANLLLDGSPEVFAMFPDSKGQRGDMFAQNKSRQIANGIYGGMRPAVQHLARGDSGSAARFFSQFPRNLNCEVCDDAEDGCEACWTKQIDPLFYSAKAGKTDRNGSKHPTVKPVELLRYLIRHITPPGGIVLDPFAGSGTTGVAAGLEGMQCILMEAEQEYVDFLERRFGIGDFSFEDYLRLIMDR